MFQLDIKPAFSDTDALGHINNTRLPVWFENAREPIFKLFNPTLDLDNWPLILAHLSVDFTAQIYFDRTVTITTELEKIGTSSITLRQCAWQDDACAAASSAVMVYFDYQTNSSAPIPSDIRAKLSEHLIHKPPTQGI